MIKIGIYDFDNTIYYNPENDFTSYIKPEYIVDVNCFQFETCKYLITGRYIDTNFLENKVALKHWFFNQITTSILPIIKELSGKDFETIYIKWKISKIIDYIITHFSYLAKNLEEIYIYDDNLDVLNAFLDLKHLNIHLIHVILKSPNKINKEHL